MAAKVLAARPGAKVFFGSDKFCTEKIGFMIDGDEEEQLAREIAGDPGCAHLDEPCAECRRACEEHEQNLPALLERYPQLPGISHNDRNVSESQHICAADAHRGHTGVPGRTDVRLEREEAPKPTRKQKAAADAAKE